MQKTTRLFLCLFAFSLICSCDATDQTKPLVPEELTWVKIDISPNWAEAPWSMTRFSTTYEGIGDSVMSLNEEGQFHFYGGNVENMIRDPFPTPLIGEASFGDTLSFHLDYSQTAWGHLYPETGFGSWYGLYLLDGGGAMLCGYQDQHPRFSIVDRNGQLVMNETLPENGTYDQIIPFGSDGVLVGGQDNYGVIINARDLSGQELWNHRPDLPEDLSFGKLVPNTSGGFLLLALSCDDTPLCSPTLAILDGNCQLISRHQMDGDLHQVGLSVSPRSSSGYYLLRARLTEAETLNYANELLILDDNCEVLQTIKFGTNQSGLYGSTLACANGDVVFTFHNHQDGVTTDVVRLSDSGQTLWQINLETEGIQTLNVCEESSEGNFLLVGQSHSGGPPVYKTWLVELSPAGEVLRNRQASTGSTYIRLNIAGTAWDGGVFAAGQYGHDTSGSAEAWINRSQTDWFFEPLPE